MAEVPVAVYGEHMPMARLLFELIRIQVLRPEWPEENGIQIVSWPTDRLRELRYPRTVVTPTKGGDADAAGSEGELGQPS